MEDIKKILVRGPNWIGDAVLSLPSIEILRGLFPKSEITLLVRPWVSDVYINNPFIDRILHYDSGGGYRDLRGLYRLIRELRNDNFDLAILLQNAFEAALIACLAGIPYRLGYNRDGRFLLLTKGFRPSPIPFKRLHHVYYYMGLMRPLGYNDHAKNARPRIYLEDGERTMAMDLLKKKGILGPVIGINPGASYGDAKRWGLERFAYVARELIERVGAWILIFGSKDERHIGDYLVETVDSKSIYNMMGETTLRMSIAVIDRCSLFITNDTGPMHIASALDVPTLAIFGPTDPEMTGPLGEHRVIIKKEVECSPCVERTCPYDHRCMGLISVDDILEASLSLLERGREREMNDRREETSKISIK